MHLVSNMNLNRHKFDDKDYQYKSLRDILQNCLGRNDIKAADLGPTFYSNTHETRSELDHIYFSSTLINEIKYSVYNSSATDHSPTIVALDLARNKVPIRAQYKIVRNMKK